MPSSLAGMDAACLRFRAASEKDYSYRHVLQGALTAVTDSLIAHGVIDPKGGKPRRDVQLPKPTVLALLYNSGSAFRILGLLCAAKQIVLVQLLEAARASAVSNSLIGTLTNFRSVVEHIAHFDAVIRKLQPHEVPDNYDEARKMIGEINGSLVKMAYSTRFDWMAILRGDAADLLRRNKTKYKPDPNRQDRTADTILDAIDGLAKKVKGLRGVYEVLCEFAHPNVGTVLGLTKSAEPHKDELGVPWMLKEVTLGAPVLAVQEMGDVLNAMFRVISQSVEHFTGLLVEADKQRSKIQSISQVVIRRAIQQNPGLLSPYAPCPCDSGAKVRFCCGRARKGGQSK